MFGFPINLQSNDIENFTNNADSGFPKIQQREVFYSMKDGVWFDRTTWQTASGRVGLLPTANDDVYIRHNVNVEWSFVSFANIPIEVNNIIVTREGKLLGGPGSGYDFRVFGDFKYYGIYDSLSNGFWDLRGLNNYIDKTRQTTNININYNRAGDQPIMDALYGNISFGNRGFKYTTCDLIINNLTSSSGTAAFYLMNPHSLTCNGTYNVFFFYSDTEQNITFKGTASSLYLFFCSKNPTIEFQNNIAFNQGNYGGITIDKTFFNNTQFVLPLPYGALQSFYFGTGLVKFTTNNITINNTGTISLDNNFLIDPNIIVTNNVGSNMNVYGTWNGSNGVSALINKGTINFASSTSVTSMTTGVFDITTFANTVAYSGNYSATIPSAYTTFHNLTIGGTGTKTLGINTTLNGNLTCLVNSTLELSTFNLIVNGTTTIGGTSIASGLLSKNGAGSVLFVGAVNSQVNGAGQRGIDFSGNPNVEFRNGLLFYTLTGLNTGTGTWTFSTISQTINFANTNSTTFNCTLLISGAINLTLLGGGSGGGATITNINGNNAASTLINAATLRINNNTGIMSTGLVDFTSNVNTVSYIVSGNYTIPNYSYYSLLISGGGIKTLNQNTTLLGNLTVQNLSTLECSSFNLTVNGNTTIGQSGGNSTLSKNSSTGSLLFIGFFFLDNNTGFGIDFSGNPNVEFRGGITSFYNFTSVNTGTGTWSFTTANQTFVISNAQTLNCAISIANNIVLTISHTSTVIYTGAINGSNAASTLRLAANTVTNYRSATQPMVTGILDTSTNLNTWIYGLNNQDIKGSPTISPKQVYRNLTLNGTGVKTLQGYVSVLNTYTLTAPASVNLNGYTITNP